MAKKRENPVWGWHKKVLEKNSIVLTVGILGTVAIGGLVEIAPLFYLDTTIEEVEGVRPYSPLALMGRDVYIREGCYNCHSQMIRPLRDEVERYGHYSLAAESLYDHLITYEGFGLECELYAENLKNSWVWSELKAVRNIRPGFHKGLWFGLINAAWETLTKGLMPWTFKNHADHTQLKAAKDCTPIEYPKPDGVLTFDKLTNVSFSNTNHAEHQPCHLILKDPAIPVNNNLPDYAGPAQRYCPAGVYEYIKDEAGNDKFQINSQNCVHCKTCDIKDPAQNIDWTVPQGGDGPNYPNM